MVQVFQGISTTKWVPSPGRDSTRKEPPKSLARSAMPGKPSPGAAAASVVGRGFASAKPQPSSATESLTSVASARKLTRTVVAAACLSTFVSASWTMR